MSITTDEIRTRIKQIIGNVAGLNPARITDEASLRDELKLDSLSLLEISVDVGVSKGKARVWTCDFTEGYIRINGSYRS